MNTPKLDRIVGGFKAFATSAMLVLVSILSAAQGHEMSSGHAATLMKGLGDLHHPVSTKNAEAQQFFDQGLRLIYAFNHDEAARSFRRSAELDPELAMSYWGIAEAVGPNYNDPASEERFKQAHDAIQKAVDLQGNASDPERAYIMAMAKRFPADPKSDLHRAAENYRDAMRELVKNYPDDLDAATLFAEAGMGLHPMGTLASGRNAGSRNRGDRRDPRIGDQARSEPPWSHSLLHSRGGGLEFAGASLSRRNRLAAIAPAAGHIVHMPAHVYIRTGDYAAAVKTNEEAAAADRAYLKSSGVQGIYPMMYYSHNLHFIAMCSAMAGDYPKAHKAAEMLAAHVGPSVKDMPPLEGFMTIPMAVDVRFHKWDAILAMKAPDVDMKVATGFWHFSRGMALAGKGRIPESEAEYKM